MNLRFRFIKPVLKNAIPTNDLHSNHIYSEPIAHSKFPISVGRELVVVFLEQFVGQAFSLELLEVRSKKGATQEGGAQTQSWCGLH